MEPQELLELATDTVTGHRRQEYGDHKDSCARIAALWSALLGVEILAWQVPVLMAALKLSRLTTTPTHYDSYLDLAGYAAIGASVADVTGPVKVSADERTDQWGAR